LERGERAVKFFREKGLTEVPHVGKDVYGVFSYAPEVLARLVIITFHHLIENVSGFTYRCV
jgi:hypothetical protein